MENMVYRLIIDIYRDKSLPVEMNEVLIVPIYKKGNKRLWKNYRPIALINTLVRVMDKIITKRIKYFIK